MSRLTPGAKRVIRWTADRLLGELIGSVVSVSTDDQIVVLTYDDGPDPASTPQVLNELSRLGLTATFFVLVDRAREHPELLLRVRDEGHQIGLHGLDHRRLTDMSKEAAHDHMATGKRELERLLTEPITLFRPPYGAQSVHTLRSARQLGLTTVLWTASVWDWKSVPQRERVENALVGCRPGAILLAHDAFGTSPGDGSGDEPEVDRAELLAMLTDALGEKGYRLVSLAAGLNRGPAVRTVVLSR